ncbi:protein kinase [Copromyces sp. CBS 386.78]|nr:protein kinase [Copromyces sp. CBS 386.78]
MGSSPPAAGPLLDSRTRHDAAMPNGSRIFKNQPRSLTDEHALGMNTLRPTTSPAAAVVNRCSEPDPVPDPAARHNKPNPDRPSGSSNGPSSKSGKPRGRSIEPPSSSSQPAHRHRNPSRHCSPDRSARSSRLPHRSRDSPRSRRDRSREPRGRDGHLSPDRRHRSPGPLRGRGDAAQERGQNVDHGKQHSQLPPRPARASQRGSSRSPGSSKRRRSRTPSPGGPDSKKSRRGWSPRRGERDDVPSVQPPRDRRRSPFDRRPSRSPNHHERRRSRDRKRSARSRSPDRSRRRKSRSPDRGGIFDRISERVRRRSPSPRHRGRSDRPDRPERRRQSRSRSRTPPHRENRHPASDAGSRRRPSPDPDSREPYDHPQGSPRDRRRSKSSKKGKSRDEQRPSSKFDPASGVNSIEVNMAARNSYRGGYGAPMPPGYAEAHDGRSYSHSSGHATPNSSFHGSPPAQSPYGAGRGWNNLQFSPQSQYGYPHGNYGPPTGPQAHYNQGHSSPYPPTGPAAQYPTGPYRGGHRAAPGGFRGGSFGVPRGGHRGGSKGPQWSPNAHNASGRGQYPTTSESNSAHAQNSAASSKHADSGQQNTHDGTREDVNNSSRSAKDSQDDTNKSSKEKEEQMQPPTRPAATSQSQPSNKFSFSMKNAVTKPVVAAPRPEISLKFNAVIPPREPSSQKQPPKAPAAPPTAPSAHRSNRDRHDLPKNVPTEPASARARHNDRRGQDQHRPIDSHRPVDSHRPAEPQKPRTRIVKRIVKKLKEKPALPPDLAKSKSVYHRKPGNESVIGSGTYGKVFKALNVYTKKQVALKRIRMEGERDGFPVTAVREIKLLRSLSHKNIVKLMEVMVEMNECFMVFEYLSHDLTGLINHPNYTLDPAQKKHLALQLFEGLDYLHTRGVLHRDIKAANILVSNEGVLKLADFGLARFYAKHHQLDYTNRVITIWYRSPELLLGETQYGPAVDIWSAACVMMEIFTKRAIFPGDGSEINQLDKIHSVLGTPTRNDWPNIIEMPWFELLRPTQRRANVFAEKYKELVTPAAFELLLWMFKYDPDKRPSAAEVLAHPYFTAEEPAPRQAVELKDIDGEWHEFESKALRKENERKEREARRAVKEGAPATTAALSGVSGGTSSTREKDRDLKKRPAESREPPPSERDSKRPHLDQNAANKPSSSSSSAPQQQREPDRSSVPTRPRDQQQEQQQRRPPQASSSSQLPPPTAPVQPRAQAPANAPTGPAASQSHN